MISLSICNCKFRGYKNPLCCFIALILTGSVIIFVKGCQKIFYGFIKRIIVFIIESLFIIS